MENFKNFKNKNKEKCFTVNEYLFFRKKINLKFYKVNDVFHNKYNNFYENKIINKLFSENS